MSQFLDDSDNFYERDYAIQNQFLINKIINKYKQMENKINSGVLFANDKKESENQPDMTGNFVDSNGKKWRLACWQNTSQSGMKYLSLKTSEFQTETKTETKVKDDMPF